MMLIGMPAEGLTFYGDYPYFYDLARLSDQGLWPYVNYWMEYPPVFSWIFVLVYQLTPHTYDAYVFALGLVMTAFGTGNLVLLMRLAARLHGEATAIRLGWVYSILFVPLLFLWWQFEAITAFCLLLALDQFFARRDGLSAIAAGVGTMVKIIPALIVPAVLLMRPLRRTLIYSTVLLLTIVAIIAPLYVAAPETTSVSLASPGVLKSWETVWALIDGNQRTGLLGPIDIHRNNDAARNPIGNPPVVPDSVKLIVFSVIGLLLLWKVWKPLFEAAVDQRTREYRAVGVVAITYVIFLLWSKGWSPQWQLNLFPLVLLILPGNWGIGYVLLFSLVNLAEWPVLIGRGLWEPVTATIILRTVLLVLLAIKVHQCMRQPNLQMDVLEG